MVPANKANARVGAGKWRFHELGIVIPVAESNHVAPRRGTQAPDCEISKAYLTEGRVSEKLVGLGWHAHRASGRATKRRFVSEKPDALLRNITPERKIDISPNRKRGVVRNIHAKGNHSGMFHRFSRFFRGGSPDFHLTLVFWPAYNFASGQPDSVSSAWRRESDLINLF